MIPLALTLHNFMCYRDRVPVQLEGIHLACLAGENGAGKSALLDAITWALWGRSRARSDDDLIHLGQTEMEVQFDFLLGRDRYRVIRGRSSKGRGRSVLELQVQSGDTFRALTEPTIRETQERIIRLLKMDYDTFINSAFLLQGRADEFTTRPPGQRKEVLARILGLDYYDELQDRARECARRAEQRRATLSASIAEIEAELAHEDEYRQQVHDAEQRTTALNARLREAEADLRQAQAVVQDLEAKERQARDLAARLTRTKSELDRLEGQILELQQRIAADEQLLAHAADIEAGHAAWLAARQADEAFNSKLTTYLDLTGNAAILQQAIASERQRLQFQATAARQHIAELEPRAAQVDRWRADLDAAQARLAELITLGQTRDAWQADLDRLNAEVTTLHAENKRLKGEMEELKARLDTLQAADMGAGPAHCPLCESELDVTSLTSLIARLRNQGTALAHTYRANTARVGELNQQIADLRARLLEVDKALQTEGGLQRQVASLEHALAEAEAAATDLVATRQALIEVERSLEKGEFALEDQARLAKLQAQIAALGYDQDAHRAVQARVTELAGFEGRKAQLDMARERLAREREMLQGLSESVTHWRESLAEDQVRHQALLVELADLPARRARAEAQEEGVERLRREETEARLALGAARQRLEHCNTLRRQGEEKRAQEQAAAEEKGLYEELALAFGKKGLQAMIIEAAIPELEEEANRLLARMTDGRMHIRFETQRETKKGDPIETLDIAIADEVGTRPYENYSGGEQYRVNFAIRIALSKLLARRAGAQLQTIILDEGFGTQDTQGRSRLVEAINAIADDFDFILVITHIEELQDVFPVRIDVTKTGQGSRVSIN